MARARTPGLPSFSVLLLAAGLALAGPLGGCDCEGGGGTHGIAPQIVVTPASVVFDRIAVLEEAGVLLLVKNDGNDVLDLEAEPVLVENGEDAETELAMRSVLSPVDCASGAPRSDDTPLRFEPGECASVLVVYLPRNLGSDTGALTFTSNDPDNRVLTVPIEALGAAPEIEVCILPGDCTPDRVCNEGAVGMDLVFPLTQLLATTTCAVSITNSGELPLKDLAWNFKSGNRRADYVLDPVDLATLGDLATGEGVELQIEFTPKSGGTKPALLEITSSDPDESAVVLRLDGMGDGPKVCPDPFPAVDFGQVAVGQTVAQDVSMTNCGTMDLEITQLALQNATGSGPSDVFADGAGWPGLPIALAPGESAQVPVEFTPLLPLPATGRLYLESTDPVVPTGWVNLVGEGIVPPSCRLQAATMVLSFGQAARNFPVKKSLAISNPGELDCTEVTATITAGADKRFSLTAFPSGGPPWTLAPGQIAIFELEYNPADVAGPDTGVITLNSPDAPTPIDVQLHGDPVADPTCKLDVVPRAGNFTADECALQSMTTGARVAQFGAVKVSQEKVIPVTLTNIGSANCNVSSVAMVAGGIMSGIDPTYTLVAGANRVLVNGTATTVIKPGERGEVQVRYKPSSEAQNCGALEIKTNDTSHAGTECAGMFPTGGTEGCFKPILKGQGVRSAIEVIPSELDFGVITVGCSSQDRDLTLYNIGGADLVINAIYLDPPGKGQPPSGPFSLTAVPPLPVTVAGGGTLKLKLKYRPPDATNHSALLVIESDAQNGNFMTTPVLGRGTTDSHQTDTFTQLSEPQVDVLWVVDDSCSMGEEQSNIASNARNFLSRALNLSTDFQVGVVTTDMDAATKSGRLQSRNGHPKIITRTSPDPVGAFADNVRQGTSGDATEKGLDAAHRALSDPLINDPAANQGFLRQDAKLVIVAVSDEEDHSQPVVDFYVDFFKNLKGYRNSDLMSFSSIVGYDEQTQRADACSSSDGDAAAGVRYVEVATRTGGLRRSICSNSWGQIADDLGLDAFGAKSQFFLTREPIASTINARVNGQLVPQAGNWTYDSSSNSVIFEATAVPPQAATVVIDYEAACH